MHPDVPIELSWLKTAGDFIGSAGLPGVIAVLLYVIRILWLEISERDKMIRDLQEKRATDTADLSKTITAALTASSLHVSTNTAALQDSARLLQSSLDVVRILPGAIEGISRGLDRNASKIDEIASGRHPR